MPSLTLGDVIKILLSAFYLHIFQQNRRLINMQNHQHPSTSSMTSQHQKIAYDYHILESVNDTKNWPHFSVNLNTNPSRKQLHSIINLSYLKSVTIVTSAYNDKIYTYIITLTLIKYI